MDICTIIAKNYVSQARVLANSFMEHHPGGRCFTLLIDDFDGYIDPDVEPFEILTPAQIGCVEFEEMALRYDVLELSTAVKPWLLRYLLTGDRDTITYLDPDICIYGSLERLDELARLHRVVVTPHNTEPLPDDGERPNQIDILLAGVYNLGYVSLRSDEETDKLLGWWEERLLYDCRVDPSNGYFVDQRWFDLAPGLVSDHAVLREPQYNVAYWNLHARELAYNQGKYSVDGRELAFFHFSGFDPEDPEALSRHQSRLFLRGNPALERICTEYAAEVIAAGYTKAKVWPYTYAHLPVGVEFTRQLRKLHGVATERGEVTGSPFSNEGCESFMGWLAEPAPGAPTGVNRLLADVYGTREDLQKGFPGVAGVDHQAFLDWAKRSGTIETPMLALLPAFDDAAHDQIADEVDSARSAEVDLGRGAPDVHDVLPVEPTTDGASPRNMGVNVVGYFQSEHGVGEAARQLVAALDAAGVPLFPVHSAMLPLSRQEHDFVQFEPDEAEFPINVICVNADMLPEFARRAGERFFADRYSIGLWFWEVTSFPSKWRSSFSLVDEVWAPTAHVAEALSPVASVPVTATRIPVEVPTIVPRSRSDLGVPDGFCFLFTFDYLSVFERKNPIAVVEAFVHAFEPDSGPNLVIKCMNADHDAANHGRLLAAVEGRTDISVVDDYMSPNDKNALIATCDCYVSLHRSEGFGLTMAEAMYLGKPVIATGYSGNLDFMTTENSLLVDYELVAIGAGAPPYPPDGEWAEPSVEHAAELMRLVYDDPPAAAALGGRAAEAIRTTHSPAAAGELMRQRLDTVCSHTKLRDVLASDGAAAITGELTAHVMRGPSASLPVGRNPFRRAARKSALRLMRPLSAYQQAVNSELIGSLDTVEVETSRLHDRLLRSNAQVLARLRSQEQLKVLPAVLEAQSKAADHVMRTLTELGGRVDRMGTDGALESDRELYLALAQMSERYGMLTEGRAENDRVGPLGPFELRVFSQNGEDGVLAEILTRIGVGDCFFIEFGVESGREGNCVYLADVAGWRGLFMECDDTHFKNLALKYRANDRVRTTNAIVTPDNVEELFAKADVPPEPSVLSIDVDGDDYWIWEAIESYRPRVVIIEYNSALDPDRKLVQPRNLNAGWDGTDYYGASLGALQELGRRKGYQLVHTDLCGVNAFFVREDLSDKRFPSAGEIPVVGCPNYFQRAYHHPVDPHGRHYLDLDTGESTRIDCSSNSRQTEARSEEGTD